MGRSADVKIVMPLPFGNPSKGLRVVLDPFVPHLHIMHDSPVRRAKEILPNG
jgi:hypothetical protein